METAKKKQYPTVLGHIHIDQETIHKHEMVLSQAKKVLQGLEDYI
jgi:hypothetical protein